MATLFGDIASRVLRSSLSAHGKTSSKYVIDMLDENERRELFDALTSSAERDVVVCDVTLGTVLTDGVEGVDIMPIFVAGEGKVAAGRNVVTEGFASTLRDFFAHGATRPRALVTFTARGNETQRSATDRHLDRALLEFDKLCEELCRAHDVGEDDPRRAAVDGFRERRDARESWSDGLSRVNAFFEKTNGVPPREMGGRLGELGCFFKNGASDWAETLTANNTCFEEVRTICDDPLVDTPKDLLTRFEADTANKLIATGPNELGEVDFASITRRTDPEGKTKFVLDGLDLEGAHNHVLLRAPNHAVLALVTSTPARLRINLTGPLKEREYVHFVGWDNKRNRATAEKGAVSQLNERRTVEVAIPVPDDGFQVWKLIVSGGPRSYARYRAVLWVAVYASESPLVAVEVDHRLSLDKQAWVEETDTANFEIHVPGKDTTSVKHARPEAPPDDLLTEDLEEDEVVSTLNIDRDGGSVSPRIYWLAQESAADDDTVRDTLESVIYGRLDTELRGRLIEVLSAAHPYVSAVKQVTERGDAWAVTLSSDLRIMVRRWNDFGEEEAVARLLAEPSTWAVSASDGDSERNWTAYPAPEHEALTDLVEARTHVLDALREATANLRLTQHGTDDLVVAPLGLVDLSRMRDLIETYLGAWLAAYDALVPERVAWSSSHRDLIELDILRVEDASGELERLIVLPTHPWLISAMLHYQDIVAAEFVELTTSRKKGYGLQLRSHEVAQLAHTGPLDDWYAGHDGRSHLRRTDGAPFHWTFVPDATYRRTGGMAYLSRVIRNKIRRYLGMHRHLMNPNRTLRIGFVNPGDGKHLLAGIRAWIRERRADEHRLPDVEVVLFGADHDRDVLGEGFDRFFATALTVSHEDATQRLLLEKLRYLKSDAPWPEKNRDYVHICFVRGLLKEEAFQPLDREITEGWDGGFGDGLLGTTLRRTATAGDGRQRRERGLWLQPGASPTRQGLRRFQELLRGRRQSMIDPAVGLFWGARLPELDDVECMYQHSDWVVHLDRALGLEVFRRFEAKGGDAPTPTVIEYSDQEDPEAPGYDTITVTQHASPYIDQLWNVLRLVDLNVEPANEVAHRSGQDLLRDINALSGTWALDFIVGNISLSTWRNRLKGDVGAALVYRWLHRVEEPRMAERFDGAVVALYVSLEEILRATPAANLPTSDGLYKRYSNEEADDTKDKGKNHISDDLLVLYLTPPEEDGTVRIAGRVIEVKFGQHPEGMADKAVAQVRTTHDILTKLLSGDASRRDAPFRNRQLSMLIKTKLEQADAMELVPRDLLDKLQPEKLSGALAQGHYRVDYTMGVGGQNLLGDVFLLRSRAKEDEAPAGTLQVEIRDGVRVITVGKTTLEWLAFHPDDTSTLHGAPTSTLPDLGRYGGLQISAPQPAEPPPDPQPQTHESPPPSPIPDPAPPELPDDAPQPPPVSEPPPPSEPPPAVEVVPLADACKTAVCEPPHDPSQYAPIVERLERALKGHKIALEAPPSLEQAMLGPRLLRVHVQLRPGESISSVRRISEDLARDVGTASPDVHVSNVPEMHAIGVDLPMAGLTYAVTYEQLQQHPSFASARHELALGFCAGIEVTGRPVWVDLARMPHALVAGTTGSGKTVFLRQLLLTLLLHHSPRELEIRLSSSKPMDFMPFTKVPHARGKPLASDPHEARALVDELIAEMDRRITLISEAACDNLAEFNGEHPPDEKLPYMVAIIDEYAETVLSFPDKSDRTAFENGVARLAQKSRAAGIHMVLCMQRPDSAVLQGPIKANILHRFALKLPQSHDSRVILDENGAETLLGQGDMLYKNANGRVARLQVPNLEKRVLKRELARLQQ